MISRARNLSASRPSSRCSDSPHLALPPAAPTHWLTHPRMGSRGLTTSPALAVFETSLPLDQRMPAGGKLKLEFEANMSSAMAYDRLLGLAPPVASESRGSTSSTTQEAAPLPGRPSLLDVSNSAEGEATRAAVGWRLRIVDGVVTGYYRDKPTDGATAASPQLQRPWIDGQSVQPIGDWWRIGRQLLGAANEGISQRLTRRDPIALFHTYAPDQSALREELLDVCRAGLSVEYVDTLHQPGCRHEWCGLPDVASCQLPADAQIDATRLEQLLVAGAFPDPHDARGRTPLFYACLHGDAAALHLLLRAGASPQHVPWDRAMLPPIFWAAYFGAAECVVLLGRYGAVPFCEGGAGSHYTLATGRGRPLAAGEGYHTLESFRVACCTPALKPGVAEAVETVMREAAIHGGQHRNILFQ